MLKNNENYKIEILENMEVIQSSKKDPQIFNLVKGQKFVGRYIDNTSIKNC